MSKDYSKLSRKNIEDIGKNMFEMKKLRDKQAQLMWELVVSIQAAWLCKEGEPKSRSIGERYAGSQKKTFCVVVKNTDDEEFICPLEDCPHELRADLLSKFDYSYIREGAQLRLLHRKNRWLDPYFPYTKENENEEVSGQY